MKQIFQTFTLQRCNCIFIFIIFRCRVEHLHVYRSVIIADIRCKDQLITLGFDLKVESNEPEIIWKNTWKREGIKNSFILTKKLQLKHVNNIV